MKNCVVEYPSRPHSGTRSDGIHQKCLIEAALTGTPDPRSGAEIIMIEKYAPGKPSFTIMWSLRW